MIKCARLLLLSLCLMVVSSTSVLAEAPVVDDSENFAILDEQQVATEQPVAKAQLDDIDNNEEIAIARDDHVTNHDNSSLLTMVQNMQKQIQELRGQLEVQSHDLKQVQQQQLAFYKDLDARLSAGSATVASLSKKPTLSPNTTQQSLPKEELAVTSTVSPTRVNPADEQIRYLAAYDLVKHKRYDNALTAMQAFVKQYPQGGYTANAHYWLGELYMVKNNYPKAIEHFDVVVQQFTSSSKVAASNLKIGYALAASGKTNDAKIRLRQVLKNYPDTPTAQLAAKKLESLSIS